jgi:hypothetical protein
VFDESTAPNTPRLSPPGGHVHLPPPTAPQRPQPAYQPTAPQYPAQPDHPGYPSYPSYPSYPEQPYPDPTRPQPRLPDGGRPQPRQRSWDERPGHERRPDERDRGRGRDGGRGGRDRGPGRGFPLGMGFVLGAGGLVCFLLSLLVLPWFEVAGQEVTLADLREAFTVPETNPDSLPGAGTDPQAGPGETGTTLLPGAPAIPSQDEIQDAIENEVRDAATEAAASAIDSGKARYLEIYTETLWLVLAVAVSLAVLFSTILSPRSFALSLLLGFRRLSGFVTVVAGIVHGVALWIVFTGDGSPDPAFGIWLGIGGLIAVLLGCVVGPKR